MLADLAALVEKRGDGELILSVPHCQEKIAVQEGGISRSNSL
jgi:hypothetical protein